MANPLYYPIFRAFDSTGAPLAGGLVYTYQAGTSTPLSTFTDSTMTTPNTNPVVLDAQGVASIWLNGTYKINLTDSNGVQQDGYPVDNFQNQAGAQGASGTFQMSTAGGTVDAITASYTPNLTLSNLTTCGFVASGANTSTTPTFAPDGLTAHTIVKKGGQALVAGDIPGALAVCIVEYNSANTRWELLNPASVSAATDATITTSDITTNNVSSTKHGFQPKSPADATQFLNGAATPAYAAVKDSDLALIDVTTNNVSTTKHGFAPKAPNDATKYLDGTGAYSVPASGGVPTTTTVSVTSGTTVTFTTDFSTYAAYIIDIAKFTWGGAAATLALSYSTDGTNYITTGQTIGLINGGNSTIALASTTANLTSTTGLPNTSQNMVHLHISRPLTSTGTYQLSGSSGTNGGVGSNDTINHFTGIITSTSAIVRVRITCGQTITNADAVLIPIKR